MNKEDAQRILEKNGWIGPGDSLTSSSLSIDWTVYDSLILLDGNFTAEELEALAWWMKNKNVL